MNKTAFTHTPTGTLTYLKLRCVSLQDKIQDRPDSKSLCKEVAENDRKPAGFPCSRLLSIKQIFYSILTQDAAEGHDHQEGKSSPWHSRRRFGSDDKQGRFIFTCKGTRTHRLIAENTEVIQRAGKAEKRRVGARQQWSSGEEEKPERDVKEEWGKDCYQGPSTAGCDMWRTGRGSCTDIDWLGGCCWKHVCPIRSASVNGSTSALFQVQHEATKKRLNVNSDSAAEHSTTPQPKSTLVARWAGVLLKQGHTLGSNPKSNQSQCGSLISTLCHSWAEFTMWERLNQSSPAEQWVALNSRKTIEELCENQAQSSLFTVSAQQKDGPGFVYTGSHWISTVNVFRAHLL